MPTTADKISQELWDMVTEYLPSLTAKYAATAFHFRLKPQQEKHAAIWDAIFQDLTWISAASSTGSEPVLIGKDLDLRWDDSTSRLENPYLVLVAKPFESDPDREIFLHSLRGYEIQENKQELKLTSGVILNVAHLYKPHGRLPVAITKLLDHHKRARTAFLFWQGSSIDFVNLETIVGARGIGSILKSFVGYRIIVEYPDGTRTQYRFEPYTHRMSRMEYDERKVLSRNSIR